MSVQIYCYGNKLLRKKTNAKYEPIKGLWEITILNQVVKKSYSEIIFRQKPEGGQDGNIWSLGICQTFLLEIFSCPAL